MSARPPGWVSGEPNITPTFSRIWLVNTHSVCVRLRLPVSLRIACDIIRACTPTVWSPICPSSSARGVSAATESTAITSTAPERIEHVDDLERLLAVVGLGDEQLIDVDADLLRVQRVHRVLGVDERADPAELLRLGEDVVDERRLTRRLRAEDLDDPPTRDAADPQRDVERQRPCRDRVDGDARARIPHPHDRALAELPLDLGQGALQRCLSLCVGLRNRCCARLIAGLLLLAHLDALLVFMPFEQSTVGRPADGTTG